MRLLPFLKPTKGVQIAGGGFPDSGGGGGSYTLPPATDSTLGGVKIGSGVNVTSDGTISVNGGGSYTLPPATSETLGGIKVGSRLSVESDGTLSATDQSYTLPTASSSTLGGVKVGTGLSITDGVLSATGGGGGVSNWTTGTATLTPVSGTALTVEYAKSDNLLIFSFNQDSFPQGSWFEATYDNTLPVAQVTSSTLLMNDTGAGGVIKATTQENSRTIQLYMGGDSTAYATGMMYIPINPS